MAARKTTTTAVVAAPTTSNGLFSVTETDSVVKSNNPGRGESDLTLAIRQAVATAVTTGKTYATGETWGDGGKPATKQGVNVVQTLQREGRKAGVTVKVGADSEDGKRIKGSHIIFVTAPKISRARKAKVETQ
jgi:hypothetical protein